MEVNDNEQGNHKGNRLGACTLMMCCIHAQCDQMTGCCKKPMAAAGVDIIVMTLPGWGWGGGGGALSREAVMTE